MSLFYTDIQTHTDTLSYGGYDTYPTTNFTEDFSYESILISEHELQSQFLTKGIDVCLSGLQKAHGIKVV